MDIVRSFKSNKETNETCKHGFSALLAKLRQKPSGLWQISSEKNSGFHQFVFFNLFWKRLWLLEKKLISNVVRINWFFRWFYNIVIWNISVFISQKWSFKRLDFKIILPVNNWFIILLQKYSSVIGGYNLSISRLSINATFHFFCWKLV